MKYKELKKQINLCGKLLRDCERILANPDNLMRITEIHRKSATDPGATDETVVREMQTEYGFTPVELMTATQELVILYRIMQQGCKYAERKAGIDVDAIRNLQMLRRDYCKELRALRDLRETTETHAATGYCLNGDGDEESYSYMVKITRTPAYTLRNLECCLAETEADYERTENKLSTFIAEAEVDCCIPYKLDDSLKNVVAAIVKVKGE